MADNVGAILVLHSAMLLAATVTLAERYQAHVLGLSIVPPVAIISTHAPPGSPIVTRSDWRAPSDADAQTWIDELRRRLAADGEILRSAARAARPTFRCYDTRLLPVFRQLSIRPRNTGRDLAAMRLACSIGGPSIVEDLAQSWALLR